MIESDSDSDSGYAELGWRVTDRRSLAYFCVGLDLHVLESENAQLLYEHSCHSIDCIFCSLIANL